MREGEREREKEREREREREREMYTNRGGQTDRQTDWLIDRQNDKWAERQIDFFHIRGCKETNDE